MPETSHLFVRKTGYVSASLGEDEAVLDLASGNYLGLNATAAHVWRLLETPQSVDDLTAALTDEFSVAADLCRIEVLELLEKLSQAGLIGEADGTVG